MNRLCGRAAPLACALFSGGLVLAQFPDYVETSRYGYNPLTGTTVQSRGYYNSFTGAGARTFSVTNPYTGAAVGGMAVNPYTGNPDADGAVDERALRNFDTVAPYTGGRSFKTYYNASTGTRLERQVVTNPYTGTVHTFGTGYNYFTGGGGTHTVDANQFTGGYRATGTVYNEYTGAGASSEQAYDPYTGIYRANRNSYNPMTGNVRSSSFTGQGRMW